MKKAISMSIIFFLLVFLTGCVKDYFDTDKLSTTMQWEPNIAVPLAKADLKIRDVLQDYDHHELFEEDQTGFLYLVYKKKVYSAEAKDIIDLQNQQFTESYVKSDVDAGGFNPNHLVKTNISYPFSVANSQLLDSIIVKYLDLTVSVQSSFQHTGTLVITFPLLTKNGIPFTTTVNINTSSGTFSSSNTYSDFDGYSMNLTGLTGFDTNKVFINYDLTLFDSGTGTVNPGESCDITVNFNNLDYHALFGYLGQDTIAVNPDTVHLEIFDHAFAGTAYFEDPHIYIYMNNSYGVPIDLDFADFSCYSTVDNSYSSFPFPLSNVSIDAPTISQIGTSANTTVTLDTNNFPQLRNILNESPKYLFFGVDGRLNPGGYTKNFATDSSYFDVDVEVNLPLWGYASYFVLEDTVDINMADYFNDYDEIEWVRFLYNVDNGMPTQVRYQVYFDDSLHNVIDSIFHSVQEMQIVESGVLDANYKVIAPTHRTTDIKYERPELDKIKYARYIRFRGYVQTTDFETAQLVKFYSYYTLSMKVGLQVQASINTGNQ